jgi:hypothetical protein
MKVSGLGQFAPGAFMHFLEQEVQGRQLVFLTDLRSIGQFGLNA